MWFAYALTSAVLYASLWLFARASRGTPTSVVAASANILGPVVLIISLRNIDFPWDESWWYWYLPIPTVILPIMMWLMTASSQRSDVTIIKPLSALSTITTFLFSVFVFSEQFSLKGILGLSVITAGLLILYHGQWSKWKNIWPWIILICVLLLGINVSILSKVLTFFPHPFAIIGLGMTSTLIWNSLFAKRAWSQTHFTRSLLLLLGAFAIAVFSQDIVTLIALTMAPAPYVVAIKRTSILLASLGGYFLFKEKDQSLSRLIISSCIVIVGVVLLNIR
ncbi:EamA family transporter [Patescibacteria group bacterium]|nr:EamA family transporter [Patescibacteria group bacterium]